ncbi:hormogonium polysaccharide biosynthesis glycosyltransferase HpsE [Leptolyngbya ohadii]|uniref:hormogonium polysaccharide biosynthesis glycosyltransferase HpsE n=1 Tax=Leptolyngbya ohadii TaxID=1962290 RepID=UPI000B5A183D|nr:hormogonium polysaccharide biosynthesis glycosyltransferase HpsE [Leptolyngbya ohadii]
MTDFTVVIPTYNGEHRLPGILQCLRSQVCPPDFSWEIIVVDNNSADRTAQLIAKYQTSEESQFPCPLRYAFEPRQGAGFARQLGIEEAHSEFIGFLDDDNLPDEDWVTAAYLFAQSHPQAGAIASRIWGDFAVPPAPELKPLLPFLALTNRGDQPLRYDPRKPLLPPSAGLVVRRSAWQGNVPSHLVLNGRTPGSMVTGEDLEVLAHLQRSGWEIWYNPAMKLRHTIAAARLQAEYLLPFFNGIGLSRYATRMAGLPTWQRGYMTIAYAINDLRKIVLHQWNYRGKVRSNLVAACQWELLKSSFISPLYLWQQGYLKRFSQE